jgi:ferric enterobactin receptor
MKKYSAYILVTILSLMTITGFAQFPGGGGGFPGGGYPGGGGRGSGQGQGQQGRPGQEANRSFNMEQETPKGNSKITGYVIDSAVTVAVEYANVALINQENNQVIDGAMADENGKFQFTRVAPGTYSLKISFIGYIDGLVKNVTVKKGEDLDLGTIKLSISAKILDEVTVTGLRSIIEEKVDRLVYNAENDISSKGGDGADVLRKVPMLSVDLDGNVSLRGSSNIRVLINNKPSTIVASSVADALKMIPADLIKTVEVITAPSARYDAEGTSGIINIITKRSSVQGYNLNINSGVGIRGSNLGLNGNMRVGKVGISLGGFGRANYNPMGSELEQITNPNTAQERRTKQITDGRNFGYFGRYNLGIDVELSKSEFLNAQVSVGGRNGKNKQDMLIQSFLGNSSNPESRSNRLVNTIDNSTNLDMNLDYIKIFKPSQEWSISAQYSQNDLKNNFDARTFSDNNILLNEQQNLNANINKEITAQTDYTQPIGKNQMFEIGMKGIFREVNSDYRYLFAISGGSLEDDPRNPAGFLNYNQNIAAGYATYTYNTKNKWAFKAGLRYEKTSIDANDSGVILNIAGYDNFVPSFNISKILGSGLTIKMAYNNRIQRPGLQQLNPNFNTANPQNISMGNPNLEPEVSNNIELSLSKAIQRNYLSLSFFGRQTNNSILQITSPSDSLVGAVVTTFENIGKQQTAGINLFGNLFVTQKWSLNGGIDLYYNYLQGQVRTNEGNFVMTSNDGIVVSGRLTSQLSLNKGWSLQAFGGMRGRDVALQGYRQGMGFYNLGVRKDFNNQKGSIGIGAENFLSRITIRNRSESPTFVQNNVNYMYTQNVRVTFQYKIGNMRFVERRSKVNNSDIKEGGRDSSPQQEGSFNR